MDAMVWQYAQSPRHPERTKSCAQTYSQDNLCYGGVSSDLFLDLDVASSTDPSHGR
jgi:3-deoxy-D-manno-octulosonic-acid transferase